MEKINFRYHPNVWNMNIFSKNTDETTSVCQCCGQETEYYLGNMYCKEDIECICLECVASGKAAEKFDGTFIQDAEFNKVIWIQLG